MVKKLTALELLAHERYRGAYLTPAGERVALEVIRHHRLLELYLAETLGLHVDDVHDEADRLEHVISEELEARIDRALGFPTHDPHGDPIPDANLRWPAARRRSAAEEVALERLEQLLAAERPRGLVAAVLLRDDDLVLERRVRSLEAVLELEALPEVVVLPRRVALAVLRVDDPADGPHGAGPALDPDQHALERADIVPPFDDPLCEAPRPGLGFHASTIQSPRGPEETHWRGVFSFLQSRSQIEERLAQYVIREHKRGRPLAEILEDSYVKNRCTPEQIERLLDRPGADPRARQRPDRPKRAQIAREQLVELAARRPAARASSTTRAAAARSHAARPFDLKTTMSSSLDAALHLAGDHLVQLVHLEPVEDAARDRLDQVARLDL